MPPESVDAVAAADDDAEARQLAEGLAAGERAAVSEALNLIDDRRPARRATARALLDRLAARARHVAADGRGHRIGVTGAPGSGKSTLLDALVRELRSRDRSVGILAVDPSSQRSGGALLGDRFRMRAGTRDPGVFVRSMAARERLGGLADATYASAVVLGAVYDRIFIETVGVGQSEADVAPLVDTLLFVAQPGAGDLLQFMKAGILELPDVFVVNKADLGAAAERTAGELEAGLGLGEQHRDAGRPPVLLASARSGAGIPELIDAIEAHREAALRSGALEERRLRGRERFALDALRSRYGSFGIERLGGAAALRARVSAAPDASIFSLLDALGDEIEARLRSSAP